MKAGRPALGEVTTLAIRTAMQRMTEEEFVRYRSTVWEAFDPDEPAARYPPKRLLYNAIVQSGVGTKGFSGGEATNRHLRSAGFKVVLKGEITSDDLSFTLRVIGSSQRFPKRKILEVQTFERSGLIQEWVKRQASGKCELCREPAPFVSNGEPFLECHHVTWLRNGGSDTIDNVVALCPNCHRRMHALKSGPDVAFLQKVILDRMISLEPVVRFAMDQTNEAQQVKDTVKKGVDKV